MKNPMTDAPMRSLVEHAEVTSQAWPWDVATTTRWETDTLEGDDDHPLRQEAHFIFYDACLWGSGGRLTVERTTHDVYFEPGGHHINTNRQVITDVQLPPGQDPDAELDRLGYVISLKWDRCNWIDLGEDELRAHAPLRRVAMRRASDAVPAATLPTA